MDIVAGIGLLAGALTTASLVPQAWQIWKSKSARDISLKMFVSFCAGVGLWLTYGILQREMPIIVWNAITLVLALAIVAMKVRYR